MTPDLSGHRLDIRLTALVQAIQPIETRILAPGYTPTTAEPIAEAGAAETLDYLRWLHRQAPNAWVPYQLTLDLEADAAEELATDDAIDYHPFDLTAEKE